MAPAASEGRNATSAAVSSGTSDRGTAWPDANLLEGLRRQVRLGERRSREARRDAVDGDPMLAERFGQRAGDADERALLTT